jgi:hypothetical protein
VRPDTDGRGITPVDAATNRAGKPVAIQGAHALAIAPDGGTLARKPVSWRGQVIPIRVATNSAGKPIKVGKLPIAIAIAP